MDCFEAYIFANRFCAEGGTDNANREELDDNAGYTSSGYNLDESERDIFRTYGTYGMYDDNEDGKLDRQTRD